MEFSGKVQIVLQILKDMNTIEIISSPSAESLVCNTCTIERTLCRSRPGSP
jgi:hypothetical protein